MFSWLFDRKLLHMLQVYVQLSSTKTCNLMEMRKTRRPERSGFLFLRDWHPAKHPGTLVQKKHQSQLGCFNLLKTAAVSLCEENPAAACRAVLVTLSGRASWRPQRVTAVRFRERRQKKKEEQKGRRWQPRTAASTSNECCHNRAGEPPLLAAAALSCSSQRARLGGGVPESAGGAGSCSSSKAPPSRLSSSLHEIECWGGGAMCDFQ